MSKFSLAHFKSMKNNKEPIVALTAYDAMQAKLASENGIEIILVGDSLGVAVAGYDTTIPVTMDQMIYHTECVQRGNHGALLIGDMPFMSYYNAETGLLNAARFMRAGAEIVKLEGGESIAHVIYKLTENGIPTCGHLGLTPQSVFMEGYQVCPTEKQLEQLIDDAKILTEAGIQMLVLKCVQQEIARQISEILPIPVIGIGAGPHCDGQILIFYDILGINQDSSVLLNRQHAVSDKSAPKVHFRNFLKSSTDGIAGAIRNYANAVKSLEFPSKSETY